MKILDWQISKNFKMSELTCKCGCDSVIVNNEGIHKLQILRDRVGVINISSAYRCEKYNKQLKGASPNSLHLQGKAYDIKAKVTPTELAREAYISGFTGIGLAHNKNYNYVHLDNRNVKNFWMYDENNTAIRKTEKEFLKIIGL